MSLHPTIDTGLKPGSNSLAGGTLHGRCSNDPVEFAIKGRSAHGHGVRKRLHDIGRDTHGWLSPALIDATATQVATVSRNVS